MNFRIFLSWYKICLFLLLLIGTTIDSIFCIRKLSHPVHAKNCRVHYGLAASIEDFDGLPHHHHLASSLKVEKPDMSQQRLPASHSAAGIQKWRSSAAVVPTAVVDAAESSVGLMRHTSGTASKLEIAASEEALPNEPFKRSARDNEAATISDKAQEIKREETKDGSDALSVASAQVLVGMEDREAANVLIHASRCMLGEATEATAIADQISGGNLREDIVEAAAAGMGGSMQSRCNSKEEDRVPTSMEEKISWKISMEESEETVQMIRKLSSHSLKDVGEAAVYMSAEEALIQASVDVNDGAPVGKILRQSSLELSEVSNQGGSFSQQSSDEDGDNIVVAAALNTMGSDDESDLEAHAQGLPVVSESYEVANPIPHHDTLKLSHLQQTAIAEKPQHDETKIDPNCIHQTTSPVSGTVSGGPSSSSISSDESERPMAELEKTLHSHQQGIISVTRALERENFELTSSRDGLTHNTPHGLDVPKVHDLHIEEISSATLDQVQKESEGVGHDQQSPSATIPAIWMPGKPIMEPSVSDLSRFSYSSSCSLMSVSSYSGHSSPSAPKSPVMNLMPSPSSGLPLSTTCQETLDYPWGFLDSLSFKGSSSSESDPGDPSSPIKSPILLSLPLTSSSSPYPASVPPLEQEENPSPNDSVPSQLTTPSQTPPPPVPVSANPTFFCSSSLPELYPSHSPPQFLEPDLQEPDLQHSQVNSPPEKELAPSSVSRANLESMHQDPSDAGIELQPSLSSMLPTNTTLSLLKSAALLKPMSSEPGRSTSILLPLGTSDSPKSSSAPLTPAASPQHSSPQPSSPCCESTAALPTPASPDGLSSQSNSPGSYRWNGAQSSAPPSPTGTVIIKDSRSPSVSPVSNDSLHGPRSVPQADAPLGSHTHSPLRSPSAQLNLAFRTSPAGNLDYKDGNCAQQGMSTVLLETQEPRLSRSLDLNARKQPGAIDPDDFGEGWNWPNFDLRTGEIPHRKSHSNSPPQSVWLESSSSQLRWQSRSELVSKLPLKLVIPDFFLPPNLAPRSPDSTSPSFSPSPSEAHSHTVHKESPSCPSETCSSPIVVADLPSKSAAVSHHDSAERPEFEHNVKFLSQPAAIPELNSTSIPETHALLQASDSIEPATTMTRPLDLFCPPAPPSAGQFALRKTADETRDSSASAPAAPATAIAANDRNMVSTTCCRWIPEASVRVCVEMCIVFYGSTLLFHLSTDWILYSGV